MTSRVLTRLRRRSRDEGVDARLARDHGHELARIDAACADGSPDRFGLFRALDADTWALLLTKEYERYPNIRALLPDVPEPALQELYNGTSGAALAMQSVAFYRTAMDRFGPLDEGRLLDFGCGWGRLTRYFARDVRPGNLYGCDPVEAILEVCRRTRVPATLARSDFLPERLPFSESFTHAFSFSVFTHLSETAQLACLHALRAGLEPGGVLVLTVRPPEYVDLCELMHPLREELPAGWADEPRHLFIAHAATPDHPQYAGPDMHFGEAVITLPYVRERWAHLFDLVDVDELAADPYQLVLTLRRR
ncbi:MAG TPA: class I SAM-dependent methyltransferase [Thermoleophilaceae bacterium]